MICIKYYNEKRNELEYYSKEADSEYWDNHWEANNLKDEILLNKSPMAVYFVRRYLPRGSRIIEGGCGRGQIVYHLSRLGYDICGVDFAEKTVLKIKDAFPQLNIKFGDIKNLEYEDNYFNGYISLGVIEHFKEGYRDVLLEMARVLKSNGYLFLSFPYMSLIRKIKVNLGYYRRKKNSEFYQYALDHKRVINDFKRYGFIRIKEMPYGGLIGFKEEIWDTPIFKFFFKYHFLRYIRYIVDILLSPIFAHNIFIVFKKK